MSNNLALTVFSIASPGAKCIDGTLIVVSLGTGIFGIINIIFDTLTGIGYLVASFLAIVSLFSIKRMRLRATVQKSVNVLKEENDELKENNEILQENNEDLKENVEVLERNVGELEMTIADLKEIENELNNDLETLKTLIGLVGNKSDDTIKEIKEILERIRKENDRHHDLIKRQILTYLYTIEIPNENHHIIINFKDILTDYYPSLGWKKIVEKIKSKELL